MSLLYNATFAFKKIKRYASSAQKNAKKEFDKAQNSAKKKFEEGEEWAKLKKLRLKSLKIVADEKAKNYKQLYLTQIKINSKKERFKTLEKQLKIAKEKDTEIDKDKKIQNEVSNVIYLLMDYKLKLKLFGNSINAIKAKNFNRSIGKVTKNQKDLEKIKKAYKKNKEKLIGMIEKDRKKNLALYKKNDGLESAIQRAKGDYDKYLKKLEKDGVKNLKSMFESLQGCVNIDAKCAVYFPQQLDDFFRLF